MADPLWPMRWDLSTGICQKGVLGIEVVLSKKEEKKDNYPYLPSHCVSLYQMRWDLSTGICQKDILGIEA